MRILFVNRFYHPDVPNYATFLKSMAESVASAGYEVSVFSTRPSYLDKGSEDAKRAECINGVSVRRFPLIFRGERSNIFIRVINIVLWTIRACVHIVSSRADVVVFSTTPPIVWPALTALTAKLCRIRSIYHVNDLHPEVGLLSGKLPFPIVLGRLGKILDLFTSRQVDKIIVLSEDMRRQFLDVREVDDSKVEFIHYWEPLSMSGRKCLDTPSNCQRTGSEPLRLIYAGNVGQFQHLDVLLIAMRALENEPIQLEIYGSGSKETVLREQFGDLNSVCFRGQVSRETAQFAIADANLAITSVDPLIGRLGFPSKAASYLAAGTPVLAIGDTQSALATLLRESGAGFACELHPYSIENKLRHILEVRDKLTAARDAAFELAQQQFNPVTQLRAWVNIIDQLAYSSTK